MIAKIAVMRSVTKPKAMPVIDHPRPVPLPSLTCFFPINPRMMEAAANKMPSTIVNKKRTTLKIPKIPASNAIVLTESH